jgi:hypothetical protein
MRRRRMSATVGVLVTVAALVWSPAATAHPDHPGHGSGEFGDIAPYDYKAQHGGDTGHLDPVSRNVKVVGKGEVSVQSGGDPGKRVADVSAFGNYAYLTAFQSDTCLGGGAWIMDISDPTAPEEIDFLPTTDGNYAGEGSQVIDVKYGPYAGRQLFIHQNETCPGNGEELAEATGKPRYLGGVNIWDVTDPTDPELLVEHAGDMTPDKVNPSTVHSAFAWNSRVDNKVYAVLVDNEEFTDVDIMDITDPANPVMVNDTLDLVELFGVDQPGLTQVFSHDMTVVRIGGRYVMNMSYWDGGYVLLDVTDPTPGNVKLIAETDFAALDEERLARGHETAPEGNAHQSEFSPDRGYLLATDEDFAPYGVGEFSITTGDNAGQYPAAGVGGAASAALLPDKVLNGPTVYAGYACPDSAPVPPRDSVGLPALAAGEEAIAVVQRGPVNDPSAPEATCFPGEKADAAIAAGYDAVLFVDHHAGHNASPDLPFCGSGAFTQQVVGVCAGHDVFHHLFDSTPDYSLPYNPAAEPAIGTVGHKVEGNAEFNGWGYLRLFKTRISGRAGGPGSISQIDTHAIEESQSDEFGIGFGDLSVHEVAMDPRNDSRLAYVSYYAGGFRVVKYGPHGIKEVGAFIDEGGNNFWGVEVHKHPNGKQYVLASDRDFGLYIFQYRGKG